MCLLFLSSLKCHVFLQLMVETTHHYDSLENGSEASNLATVVI